MMKGEVRQFRDDVPARTHFSSVRGKRFIVVSEPDADSFVDIMIDGELSYHWPLDFIKEESEVISETR